MTKGMILAAGRGVRLSQLTNVLPKPLLPVANRPVMAQVVGCLQRAGIDDICANVSYRAKQIMETFEDGQREGVRLHWSVEDVPTGTAGGMKCVQHHLDDGRVVVIAGDAMLDVDLAPLIAAHIAHGAFATLGTMPVDDPSPYGVVVTDDDSRILRFQEKPLPGTEISNQVNTGIYIFEPGIFELIPAETFCDFALDVFPEILKQRLPFFAFPVQGYWTDIGNPGEYLRANLDFLAGRIRVEGNGDRVGDNFLAPSAQLAGAKLSCCVVGAHAVLPTGSTLTRCIIWPHAVPREPLCLSEAIITSHGIFQVDGKAAVALGSF